MRFSFLFHEPITRLDELEHRMSVLSALGYHGIELSTFHPADYSDEQITELSRKYRLPVVSMLSGWSHSHEGLSLCHPDPVLRGRAVCRLNDYVGQAANLDSLLVVGLMQGLRSDEPAPAIAIGRIVEGLRRVARNAESRGVQVVIEPVNHLQAGFIHSADGAAAIVERIGSPAVGYMLDTFHLNIEEQSPLQAIKTHGARIRHFHLCETSAGPLGTGHLDVRAVLSALDQTGYEGFVSVKVYRKAGWEEAARSSAEILWDGGTG
ncbi:MAG: TIM barrel protein [Isosphaeraceae bacterium]